MIWLKFTNPVTNISVSRVYEELYLFSKIKTTAITSTSLRGYNIEKTQFSWRVWEFVLAPDTINSEDDLGHLESFFRFSNRFISLDNINYREVTISAGDMPLEFLENSKFLAQTKFTVTSKAPDTSLLVGELRYG